MYVNANLYNPLVVFGLCATDDVPAKNLNVLALSVFSICKSPVVLTIALPTTSDAVPVKKVPAAKGKPPTVLLVKLVVTVKAPMQ